MTFAPLQPKAERVRFIGTVFGISPYSLVPSRFRARQLRDKIFSPPSRRRSHRTDQEY
jgi:lambda repressor-like predicted transcriptional regulator